MFDQLIGLLLLGLGIQSPVSQPAVKGVQSQLAKGPNSGSGRVETHDSTDDSEQGTSGAQGASSETEETHSTGTSGADDGIKIREMREIKNRPSGSTGIRPPKDARKEMREALKLEKKEIKESLRVRFEDHREEFENEIEKKRVEAKERMEEKKLEMEKKLETFKDENKKRKVEQLQTKIADLNSKMIQNVTERIGKISSILDETVAKKASVNLNGQDATAFESAVTAAQTAILAAQDALALQSAKTYVVSITTESNAKNDVGATLKLMNTDRNTLNNAVVEARKAVSLVIQELAKLRRESVPDSVIK